MGTRTGSLNRMIWVVGIICLVLMAWLSYLTVQLIELEDESYFSEKRRLEVSNFHEEMNKIFQTSNADCVFRVLPVGAIVAFGADFSSVPEGWIPCDGRELDAIQYHTLFEVIGTDFGGTEERFNVPDFRGKFLRGVDHQAGHDPDAASRTECAPGGNSGDQVGSFQQDATAYPEHGFHVEYSGEHTHFYNDIYWMEYFGQVDTGNRIGSGPHDNDNKGIQQRRETGLNGSHTHKITGGDKETRPVNVSVEWIIKAS